jgi:cell volume regulation protein A
MGPCFSDPRVPPSVEGLVLEVAILAAGLFVFLAHLLDHIFKLTKVPDILILMLLGVVAGNGVLGWVPLESLGEVGRFVSLVTLVVILCESGLKLDIGEIIARIGRATPFALFSLIGAVALMKYALQFSLELDSWTSLLGALVLGGTSSAVVIPMLQSLGTTDGTKTTLTLESALTDVLCIIGSVGIASALASGDEVEAGGLLGEVAYSLAVAAVLGVLSGFIWAIVTSLAKRMKTNRLTTLAFALVIYGMAEKFGVSGAITALVFGITLGNPIKGIELKIKTQTVRFEKPSEVELEVYEEIVFLLKAFFFFYLGLTVQPTDFISGLGVLALVLAALPLLPRYPAVWLFLDKSATSRREAAVAWALVPRGLAAAVLAQYVAGLGIEGSDNLAKVVVMTVFISITLVAILIFLIERGILAAPIEAAFMRFPKAFPQDESSEGDQDMEGAILDDEAATSALEAVTDSVSDHGLDSDSVPPSPSEEGPPKSIDEAGESEAGSVQREPQGSPDSLAPSEASTDE